MTQANININEINYTDELYKPELANVSTLAIDISDDHIFLAVVHLVTQHVLKLYSHDLKNVFSADKLNEELTNAITSFDIKGLSFKKTVISYNTKHFTLVPEAFYEASSTEKFLKFNHNIHPGSIVIADSIKMSNAKLCYAMHPSTKVYLDKYFPNHSINHSITVWSNVNLLQHKVENIAFLHIESDYIFLQINKGGVMQLLNEYAYEIAEDVLYYVLAGFEKYGLQPTSESLIVTGQIEDESALINLLKEYVKHIQFGKRSKKLTCTIHKQAIEEHLFWNLLA